MNTIYQTTVIKTYSALSLPLQTTWADPQLVLETINQQLPPLKIALPESDEIYLGSWNAEYLWQAKAEHFIETYAEIINRHHLLALQEVSEQGLFTISQASGYKYIVSQPNSRGQAVGFLIHPRFDIDQVYEYTALAEICGFSNLRPALRIDLTDRQSNTPLSIVNVHLKSMIGGLIRTGTIRIEQLNRLMLALDNSQNPTIITGDFNCFLDTSSDINPLLNSSFSIANKNNHTSTQSGGGRLDGLFYRNLSTHLQPKHYNIRNFWRRNVLGRSLSDHGLLTWTLGS